MKLFLSAPVALILLPTAPAAAQDLDKERKRSMGIGRSIKRKLIRFYPDLARLPKRRLANSDLSPELTRETEIVHDMSRFPANDLYRQFLIDTAKDMPKPHHYFEIYEQWFSRFRNRVDLKLLEIGVARGGSLKMWRQYFHDKATIVGLDIDPGCKAYENADENIFIEIGDQTDTSFLKHVAEKFGPFDIILDDGGHTTAQQTISFNHLYANGLNDPGVYLVEDLQTNYWPEFQDADQSFIDFAKSLVDRLHEFYIKNRSIHSFQKGRPEQRRSMKVSRFCADTRSISFYDSVIVFEKRRKSVPVLERQ